MPRYEFLNRSLRRAALALGTLALGTAAWAIPYATTVVGYGGITSFAPYNDPNAVLGAPATDFYDPWGGFGGGTNDRLVKLIEPAFNTDAAGNPLIVTLENGAWITVAFDHQVMNDPNNPFGIDFLVFGNSFYVGSDPNGGFINDSTNLNNVELGGGIFSEQVTVAVSQDGVTWYEYTNGPYGDTAFPTNGYLWDPAAAQWTSTVSDFTLPVDPAAAALIAAGGLTAADALALYNGSGGGTGFDLDVFGLDWIQYIRVTGYGWGGEIDAFADVAAIQPVVPEPATLSLLALGFAGTGLLRRRRNRG